MSGSRDDELAGGATSSHGSASGVDNRLQISIVGGKMAETAAVRKATRITKGAFCGPWESWKHIPLEEKSRMWDLFCQECKWSNEAYTAVKFAWEDKMKERVPGIMREAREKAIARYKEVHGEQHMWNEEDRDYTLLIPYPPSFLHQEHWTHLCTEVYN